MRNLVSLLLLVSALASPLAADTTEEESLLAELLVTDESGAQRIERELGAIWSRSGSDTMDYLLQRGRDALDAGEFDKAVEHLSALVDHAPGFAEGWHLRATAFFRLEELGLALSDLQSALALNPNHFAALAGVGFILDELDRKELALKALRASQAIHPFRKEINEAIERLEAETGGWTL